MTNGVAPGNPRVIRSIEGIVPWGETIFSPGGKKELEEEKGKEASRTNEHPFNLFLGPCFGSLHEFLER